MPKCTYHQHREYCIKKLLKNNPIPDNIFNIEIELQKM